MRSDLIGIVALVLLTATEAALQAQHGGLATYRDPKYGVSFSYRAEWTADPRLGFYLGANILQPVDGDTEAAKALMKVGFNNAVDGLYSGTYLDGVEFVYFVAPETNQTACYQRIRSFEETESSSKAHPVVINGVTYLHLLAGDGGLSHGASRDMYAAYLAKRCYLFESGIHTMSGADDTRPLTRSQFAALRVRLASVMRSVRVSPEPVR
jgi:hypothetical protein